MGTRQSNLRAVAVALAVAGAAGAAQAAEGFQVRYNLAGTLGAELFAPAQQQGWIGGVVRSDVRIDKVTGPDGGPLLRTVPGGTLAAPAALQPTYPANVVQVATTGRLTQYNLLLSHLSEQRVAGGQVAIGLNLPYVRHKSQSTQASGPTPALSFQPAVGPGVRAATSQAFGGLYQSQLAALGAAESGQVEGVGDLELLAGWLRRTAPLRLLVGASLVVPTGRFDAAPGPDVSLGNFYTLRPVVQGVWRPSPEVSLGGRLTYGISTRNDDTGVRSGNWLGLEAAIGHVTPVGVLGLHGVLVQQVQDDSGGAWGGNRLRASHLGAFHTARIEVIDASLSVQAMATLDSRNARHGRYLQLRLTRAF